jgi:hypothetical protein
MSVMNHVKRTRRDELEVGSFNDLDGANGRRTQETGDLVKSTILAESNVGKVVQIEFNARDSLGLANGRAFRFGNDTLDCWTRG